MMCFFCSKVDHSIGLLGGRIFQGSDTNASANIADPGQTIRIMRTVLWVRTICHRHLTF